MFQRAYSYRVHLRLLPLQRRSLFKIPHATQQTGRLLVHYSKSGRPLWWQWFLSIPHTLCLWSCLSQFNKATCWGTLDNKIYCQMRVSAFYRLSSAAPPAPKPLKQVSFSPSVIFPITNGINKKGRPILHQGGCFICNNFNSTTCTMFQCFCGGGHACPACPHNPTSLKPGEHLSTPINITVLAEALRNHPDPVFVQFLIKGFEEGFHPRLSTQPSISFEIKNLQSAITELESVDRLLAKEVKEGFMIRLFIHSPFPNFRIRPLGITTRK